MTRRVLLNASECIDWCVNMCVCVCVSVCGVWMMGASVRLGYLCTNWWSQTAEEATIRAGIEHLKWPFLLLFRMAGFKIAAVMFSCYASVQRTYRVGGAKERPAEDRRRFFVTSWTHFLRACLFFSLIRPSVASFPSFYRPSVRKTPNRNPQKVQRNSDSFILPIRFIPLPSHCATVIALFIIIIRNSFKIRSLCVTYSI